METIMELDQKHITTIRLHDAKGADVRLTREGMDYLLCLKSSSNIVNITLSLHEVRKLWEQFMRLGTEPVWTPYDHNAEAKNVLANSHDRLFTEHMATVFAKMAQQMAESAHKD
jgi:hypothetical protein